MRSLWRRTSVAVLVVPAVLGAGFVAGGCTTARNTLGTGSSACFWELPVASDAVHDRGHLAGVRLITTAQLAQHPRLREALAQRGGSSFGSVCLVAFQGHFTQADVTAPLGRVPAGGTGSFAVVVVSSPGRRLLATFLFEREPLPFLHTHAG